jgi:S-DNA-T family DNA segregation ATPase FtsK/SpoIIIE
VSVKHVRRIFWDVIGWPGWLTVWGVAVIAANLALLWSAYFHPGSALIGLILFALAAHVDDIRRVTKRARILHKHSKHKSINAVRWVLSAYRAVRIEIGFSPLARATARFNRMCEVLLISPAPMVMAWEQNDWDEVYTLRIIATATMSSSEFQKREQRIHDHFGPSVKALHIIPAGGGIVSMRLVRKDRTAEMLTNWPGLDVDLTERRTIGAGVLIGRDHHGDDVTVDVVNDAILIGGQRGTGKSGAQQVIAAGAASCDDVNLRVVDLKDGAEFWMWADKVESYADTPEAAVDVIDTLLALRTQRSRELTKMGKRKWEPGCGLPFELLIVDEVAELDKDSPDSAQAKLTKLVRLGRAQGIGVIIATQRPSADWLDTSLRAQCNVTIGFRTRDATESTVLMGPGAVSAGYCCHRLPKPGVFYIIGDEDQTPRRCRAWYLSDKDVTGFVKKLPQVLREPATDPATDRLPEPVKGLPIEAPNPADRLSATGGRWQAPAGVRLEAPEPDDLATSKQRRQVWQALVTHPVWITRGNLAKLASVSESGVSKMLRAWADKGYVEEGPGQTWRRRVHRIDTRDVA